MKDIMKIFKSLEDSSLSIKGDTKTIKNETKEKKGRVTDILSGTLGVSLLGNMLVGNERKGHVVEIPGWAIIRAGKRRMRAG